MDSIVGCMRGYMAATDSLKLLKRIALIWELSTETSTSKSVLFIESVEV